MNIKEEYHDQRNLVSFIVSCINHRYHFLDEGPWHKHGRCRGISESGHRRSIGIIQDVPAGIAEPVPILRQI